MNLIFPAKILEQHLVILGKTGAGKSSALRYIVEHLLAHEKRVCILDPKGDHFGLKFSADGKSSSGFPVIAFGDFKEPRATDVPINAQSGKHVGELITSGNRPCMIGFRGWMTSHMVKFWIDFAPTIFNANSGELFIIGDEFHNFAPKGKIMDPESGKCLHWSNRLLSEGRGLGIVCLLASQRPQKVHNDTLTSCETLVAMRVIHEADRQAVKVWIDGCGDKAQGNEVINSLAGMERGEAWIWSPEVGFGPKQVAFPMFETFDSFAPPQLQKKISASTWETVDLDQVRSKLSAVIEEHKANDPAELKRTIAELKRKLILAEQKQPEVKQSKPVEVPILDASAKKLLEHVSVTCDAVIADWDERRVELQEVAKELNTLRATIGVMVSNTKANPPQMRDIRQIQRAPVRQPKPFPIQTKNGVAITQPQQRILDALAWYESIGNNQPSTIQVGAVALMDATGGYFSNTVGPLSSAGLVERGRGNIWLTDLGRKHAQVPDKLSTIADYHDVLRDRVRRARSANGKTVEILDVMIEACGSALDTEEIGKRVGVDHTGGYFSNSIGPLSTLGLIRRNRGLVEPTEVLFPKGLS